MTKKQFWFLNITVLVACALFIAHIVFYNQARSTEQKIAVLRGVAQEGAGYYSRWEKLAFRTYQLSPQDAQLKEVLTRQQIQVTPKPGAPGVKTNAPETPPATPVPAATAPKK